MRRVFAEETPEERPPRKKVSFNPVVQVRRRTLPPPVMTSLKSSLYYSKSELASINLEAKRVVDSRGRLDSPTGREDEGCLRGLESMTLEDEDCLRGLESMASPSRKVKKVLATKGILKYHRIISERDDIPAERKHLLLATASSKISEWARLVSLEAARVDSLRVFGADYLIPVELVPVETTSFCPFKPRCNTGDSLLSLRKRSTANVDDERQPAKKCRSDHTTFSPRPFI